MLQLPPDLQRGRCPVDVLPQESQQLAAAQAERQGDGVQRREPVFRYRVEQPTSLVLRERLDLLAPLSWPRSLSWGVTRLAHRRGAGRPGRGWLARRRLPPRQLRPPLCLQGSVASSLDVAGRN